MVQLGKEISRWWQDSLVTADSCPKCGYVGFPPPPDDLLEDYYSNHYGKNSSSWYNLEEDYKEGKVVSRAKQVAELAQLYIGKVETPTIVEVGCAFGGTVFRLRELGFAAYGVDLNSEAISQGRAYGNEFVHCRLAHEFMQENGLKANLIYSYHALEHVPNLVSFLAGLKSILADDAVISFRVPNGLYLRAWLDGFENWDWFAYPDHLHMLTPYSVLSLANAAGLALIDITSHRCGEPLEALIEQVKSTINPSSGSFIETILEQAFLLKELSFVLTPKDSQVIERFRERKEYCIGRCQDSLQLVSCLRRDIGFSH